jgi:hypothetical protein
MEWGYSPAASLLLPRTGGASATAKMFRTVALNVKMAILPFVDGPIFAG